MQCGRRNSPDAKFCMRRQGLGHLIEGLDGRKISDNVVAKKDWNVDFAEEGDSVSADLGGDRQYIAG